MNQIIRSKTKDNFTIIPNIIFNSGLSLRAVGLLTYILHLPDDWVLYKSYLYKQVKEGRDAVLIAWKELEDAGYIHSVKVEAKKRGKLPEIQHIVYDNPQKSAENQLPVSQKRADQKRVKGPLLNTKVQRTKQPIDPLLSNDSNGPQETLNDEKPADIPPEPATDPVKRLTLHQMFMATYHEWYKARNGVKPKIDGANGEACKSLQVYFMALASDRAKDEKIILTVQQQEDRAVEMFAYIFKKWDKLDGFLQAKTRLLDINSNIQNIITQIKNGHSKSKQHGKPATGGSVSTSNLAGSIALHYASTGQSVSPGTD
jgi:hypothetical protein